MTADYPAEDMATTAADVTDGSTEPNGASGERSTIKFPYTDIGDAVTVARTIRDKHGASPMQLDQLAAALGGGSIKSGAFRTKLATASTFGAVQSSRGHVQLTDLGHRLADEAGEKAAMIEAFLKVPLYKKIYDTYQGKSLPGDSGLEAEIRAMGVVASQTARARQAFQRSADKAGFFWSGRARLVLPTGASLGDAGHGPSQDGQVPPEQPPSGKDNSVLSNALLAALFTKMLPDEDQPFTVKERKRFFRALAVNLDVIYGEPTDGEIDPDELAALFKDKPNRGAPATA